MTVCSSSKSKFRRFVGLENTLVVSRSFVEALLDGWGELFLAGVLKIGDFTGVGNVIVTLFDKHVEKELSSGAWFDGACCNI